MVSGANLSLWNVIGSTRIYEIYKGYWLLPLVKPIVERSLEHIYKENRISQGTVRLTLSLHPYRERKYSVICPLPSFPTRCWAQKLIQHWFEISHVFYFSPVNLTSTQSERKCPQMYSAWLSGRCPLVNNAPGFWPLVWVTIQCGSYPLTRRTVCSLSVCKPYPQRPSHCVLWRWPWEAWKANLGDWEDCF